jgi:uncharacterized protein YbjT (DUF2867 family)
MKIVVIGGSGLVGKLRDLGHDVVSASPSAGVNTVAGEEWSAALRAAQVVVDVANSPAVEEAVLRFFEASGRNRRAAESVAGVRHHVALWVDGTDRLLESGDFRAKMAREDSIKAAGIPYTIVRATRFFEGVGAIAQSATDGQEAASIVERVSPIEESAIC